MQWAVDLENISRQYASLCPTSSNPNVPAGLGQTLLISYSTDARTDQQLVVDTIALWNAPEDYDAKTGEAFGPSGRHYKQIVWSATDAVGCAVSTCPRGRRVVCTYRKGAKEGQAYPPLVFDNALRKLFRDNALTWINRARAAIFPPGVPALAPLSWDDALAASAQAWADKLKDVTYDASFTTGETIFGSTTIFADAAALAVRTWFSRLRYYRLNTNQCIKFDGTPAHRCGLFAQLVGAGVRRVGCGQAWKKGVTWVVCRFDKAYSSQGEVTMIPFGPNADTSPAPQAVRVPDKPRRLRRNRWWRRIYV